MVKWTVFWREYCDNRYPLWGVLGASLRESVGSAVKTASTKEMSERSSDPTRLMFVACQMAESR